MHTKSLIAALYVQIVAAIRLTVVYFELLSDIVVVRALCKQDRNTEYIKLGKRIKDEHTKVDATNEAHKE